MQRDIASYFKRVTPAIHNDEPKKSSQKKRKALVISSDEDEVPASPPVKSRESKKTRIDKNEEDKVSKPSLSKLKSTGKKELKKVVDPNSFFGGETKRVEAKRPKPPKDQMTVEMEDDEIDKSLMEIDVDMDVPTNSTVHKNGLSSPKKEKKETHNGHPKTRTPEMSKSPKKERVKVEQPQGKKEEKEKSPQKRKSENQTEKASPSISKSKKHEESFEKKTPKVNHKVKKNTPRPKKDHSDLETSVLSDEERHERRRMTAALYQKYKNRPSCLNPGSKEVPQGKPNCLAGLTFLVTGVLESLERDECGSIIKEYGGKVMSTVGKRLNYLIVGEEAGPSKLVHAEEMGVNIISEDGFFDLIREKSGEATKSTVVKKENKTPTKETKSPKAKKEKHREEKEEKIIKKEKQEMKNEVKESKEFNNNLAKVEQTEASAPSAADQDILAWVDKYKPTNVKEIVGQYGANSNAAKLTNWLSKWYINHDGKKKLQRPNPWAKNDDGSFYKAALLSGPPGIGKTTTATLVCKELGFDTVEFNASDTRSKRLLKEEVSELLSNKSLYGYFHGNAQAMTKKHVLIMDEVDGMAGNEDRGGIQELIALIKDSSIPIICMCNDRNHQKMRSLVNYCYDLRFNKPRMEQIKGRILSICCKENFKIPPAKIEEIISATNNDIRQTINHISLLSAGKELPLKAESNKSGDKTAEKDLKMGPWEVVRKVFSADEHKQMTFNDKCDLFFHDYSLAPLFVQQNYLQVSPVGPKSEFLEKVARTADALSLGDLVDKRIHSNNAWSLLPAQAIFSSVLPGEYMAGHFTGQINFPGWLGKFSRSNKRKRLAQEIHDHTRVRTSGARQSVRLDYAPFLLSSIVRPLKENGMDGVEESLHVLKDYHLLREDIESLIELTTWPGKKSLMEAVDGRVKAALTRSYNKEVLAYTYSAAAGVKKSKSAAAATTAEEDSELLGIEGEDAEAVGVESDDEEKDSLENDALIKAKKRPAAATASKASTSSKGASKKSSSKSKSSTAKK